MPVLILMWLFTLSYAMAESGFLLTQHRKLSTLGALTGQTPSGVGGTFGPGSGAGVAGAIVGYAQAALGRPYGWGQPGYCPSSGVAGSYDCSGLTRCAVAAATGGRVNLPHNAALQFARLSAYRVRGLNPSSWLPGDLVYYFIPGETGSGEPAHCAIYIGGGKVIDAPHTGTLVRIDNWKLGTVMGAFRIPASAAAPKIKPVVPRRSVGAAEFGGAHP